MNSVFSSKVCVAATVVLIVAYLMVSIGTPICFDDCLTYIPLMGHRISDYPALLTHMFRPWFVPVVFSLFGHFTALAEFKIIIAQTILSVACWVFLAYVVSGFFPDRWLQRLSYFLVLSCMFARGYYHLNQYLLSDSLSLSVVVLLIATALWGAQNVHILTAIGVARSGVLFIILAALSAAAIGARDANMEVVLAIPFLVLVASDRSRAAWAFSALLFASVAGMVYLHAPFARKRHLFNAENILVGTILPDSQARDFFLRHGMPASVGKLSEAFGQIDLNDGTAAIMARRRQMFEATDGAKAFLPDVDDIYVRYLLTHPSFIAEDVSAYSQDMFSGPLQIPVLGMRSKITRAASADSFPVTVPRSIRAAPMDSGLISLLATLLTPVCVAGWFATRSRSAAAGLILTALGASNAVLSFMGDVWSTNELIRHALIGSLIMKVGLALCLISGVEVLAWWAAMRFGREREVAVSGSIDGQ